MSIYSNLVETVKKQKINEDAGGATTGGMVGAMTASGNPSVSYLPGSFTSIKNYLNSLTPIKKQWGLETIDEGDNYRLRLEKGLDIILPKTAYDEFDSKVLKIKGQKTVLLKESIYEDIENEIESNLKRIKQLLIYGLRKQPSVNTAVTLINYWSSLFPQSKFLQKQENVLFGIKTFNNDVESTLSYIKKLYGMELSKIENLTDLLKKGEPLNSIPPFKKYSFIVGSVVRSNFMEQLLEFDVGIGMSFVATQTIRIPSEPELIEEMRAIKTVKVINDSIVPIGRSFSPNDLLLFKKILDDVLNTKGTK